MFHGLYTIKATENAKALDLVKFFRQALWRGNTLTTPEVLWLARELQYGGEKCWHSSEFKCELQSNDVITIVSKTTAYNGEDATRNEILEQRALLESGAAGDADAAITYCRMMLAGEIYLGGYA